MQRALAAFVTCALLAAATPALAQAGRAAGTVTDTSGKGIKGATVTATNREASPSEVTSATDDKGRWAMIGLRPGVWNFTVAAPGFESTSGAAPIRTTLGAPLRFVIQRAPIPIPNALSKDIADQVEAANALRAQGRLDQALAA